MTKFILKIFLLWAVVGYTEEVLGHSEFNASEMMTLELNDLKQDGVLVSGEVTDADGVPLPGVNVAEKGTSNGTQTDFDGKFSIEVASSRSVLVFSYVGMEKVERTVGDNTTINVVLSNDSEALDEVVVTALGIKRQEKTLSYSSQEVVGSDLTKTRTTSFGSNLDGKVAGLQITTSASGAGGSTKMVLRGNKSLSGTSDPLYVIDGIPMSNNRGDQSEMWGGVDEGDGLSQLNQDDIESMSVLKGANAAILYGSEGANGVVLITTKSGKEGRAEVTINSGVTFETVTGIPKMQFRYGSKGGEKESWSDTPGDYESGYVRDFFNTGVNLINSAAISGGNSTTTAYFSYSNVSSNGIVPTNKFLRNNATFKQTTKLFDDKLVISSNTMLAYEKTNNRPPSGYYLNPLTGLYMFPRERDFQQYKEKYEYFDEDRNMMLQNWFIDDHQQSNPYWIMNKEPREDHNKRVITSLNMSYSFTDELTLQVRGNYDFAHKTFEQKHAAGSNGTNVHKNGRWEYKNVTDEMIYADAMLTYDTNFGDDFSLLAVGGASYKRTVYGKGVNVDNGTDGLLYPNIFQFQNLAQNVQVESVIGSRAIKQGAFLTANLGYKDMLFLDLAGREDWASTLAGTGNDSYFYPAVGLSGVVSEMFNMPDFITFGKVRASYSVIANEVPFNRVAPQNTISSGGGISLNTTRPFTSLKPEMIHSLEFGLDWKFFRNRLGLDLTYYDLKSKDQFIELPAPSGSQYTTFFVNAGEITNKGIEASLYGTPIETPDFSWNTSLNFSTNKNKIVKTHPDLTEPITLGDSEGYQSKIVPGGKIGDLYVFKFERDDQDRILIEDGLPVRTQKQEYIGNANPDWNLGWNNSFSYKNVSLSLLVNGKFGGKVVSQTESMLDGYGVSRRTAEARDNGGVVNVNGVDENGSAVTQVNAEDWYRTIGERNGIKEAYVYDRTNVRLSELSISYDFNLPENSFFKELSLSLIGQNLFFFYKDAPFDPELSMSTGMNFASLDNFNMPSTATYGLNIRINF